MLSCVCITWYKHSRGRENSRQFGFTWVCRILPTPLLFISGNVFYNCLIGFSESVLLGFDLGVGSIIAETEC